MASIGQIIENPVSGERITFLQTAATPPETSSRSSSSSAQGNVPGAHVHPEQEERFLMLVGTMKFRMRRRRMVAGRGDTLVIPARRVRKFSIGGDGCCACASTWCRRSTWTGCSRPRPGSRLRQHEPQGHAPAATPRVVQAPLRARGPRPVPAPVVGAHADGPARADRTAALRAAPRRCLSSVTPGGPSTGRPAYAWTRTGTGLVPHPVFKPAGGCSPVARRFDPCTAPL